MPDLDTSSSNPPISNDVQTKNLAAEFLRRGILVQAEALRKLEEGRISADEILEKFGGEILTLDFIERFLSAKRAEIERPAPRPKTSSRAKELAPLRIDRMFVGSTAEKDVAAFVHIFNQRYERLKNILTNRPELKGCMSIARLAANNAHAEGRDAAVIGMVRSISRSKAGNTILELEDPTGKVPVFLREGEEWHDKILLDDMIGVRGTLSRGYVFADSLFWPDVPIPQKIATAKENHEAVFLSDLHFGSEYFIKEIAGAFIEWLRSPEAANVRYIFIAGDLVDGVGIYPGQEKNLLIKDIYAQYRALEEWALKIPQYIHVLICPGNHDASRNAEPQPPLAREFVPRLYETPNVRLVSNPCWFTLGADEEGLGGVTVLMYHGYSQIHIIDAMPQLRKIGIAQPEHILKELIKRRHLAPMYGSNVISPEQEDWLLIDKIPDIFHTGDLHGHCATNYKGITLINSSTFQAQTPFMDRMGQKGNPGKVTIVNLKTREIKVKDFATGIDWMNYVGAKNETKDSTEKQS